MPADLEQWGLEEVAEAAALAEGPPIKISRLHGGHRQPVWVQPPDPLQMPATAPPALESTPRGLPDFMERILDEWNIDDLARSGLALLAARGPQGSVAANEICFRLLRKLRTGETMQNPSGFVSRAVDNAYTWLIDTGEW